MTSIAGRGSELLALVRAAPSTARLLGDTGLELAARADEIGSLVGEAVDLDRRALVVRGDGDPAWLASLLAVLELGGRPALIGARATDAEVHALAERAEAIGAWDVDRQDLITRRGSISAAAPAVLLSTSGTTGRPALVARGEASLLAEARRYVAAVGLSADDHVLLPLPLNHAYGLGWLVAGIAAGATVEVAPPSAVGATLASMAERATIVALVPSTLRLLLRRLAAAPIEPKHLRLAMVGAGPVGLDDDERFRRTVGIGLARNYGSTETGAVFVGPPQLLSGCVGSPMAGVTARIIDEQGRPVEPGTVGRLEVRVAGSGGEPDPERWHPMGDLVRTDDHGRVEVVGRISSSIRRGDRWISPREVEEALVSAPGVAQVAVRRVQRAGLDDEMVAEVVPRSDVAFDLRAVEAHASELLAPEKRPNRFVVRSTLRASALGKVVQAQRVRRADPAVWGRARAIADLASALDGAGVAALLDGRHDVAAIADELQLDLPVLERLLDAAVAAGLVVGADGPVVAGPAWRVAPEVGGALEAALRGSAHGAVPLDPIDRQPVIDVLADTRRVLVVGEAPDLIDRLSPGAPREVRAVVTREDALALGHGGPRWDVVVAASVHGPRPGDDLAWMVAQLVPGGRLVVQDRFASSDGSTLSTDLQVLAGRGPSWLTLDELLTGLAATGVVIDDVREHAGAVVVGAVLEEPSITSG